MLLPENTHHGGRITVQLISSLTRLDLTKKGNMLFFVHSERAESKLVKLETSRTVTLPPKVSVLCFCLNKLGIPFAKYKCKANRYRFTKMLPALQPVLTKYNDIFIKVGNVG